MAITKLSNSGLTTGNLKYDSMLAGNDPGGTFLIQRVNPANGATSVTFSNIPQNYQSLQIRGIVRDTDAGTGWNFGGIRINNDSGTNYASHFLRGNGSAAAAQGNASATLGNGILAIGNGAAANIFGVSIFDIHDYASTTKYKTVRSFVGGDSNGAGLVYLTSSLWMSTSAVTSFTILPGATAFAAGSTFALYGFIGA